MLTMEGADAADTRAGVSLRDRAVGFAEAPADAGSSPFGLPSLTRRLAEPFTEFVVIRARGDGGAGE